RPDINSAGVLEHFNDRDEIAALRKLAVAELPGDPESLHHEFVDAVATLDRQTAQQRIDDLVRRQSEHGLGDAEKAELRSLLAARTSR
ncbi:MAG TPA: DNA primase, partial [Tahibacter sp.]|nr:DNA primase [Tahibacter sp.]